MGEDEAMTAAERLAARAAELAARAEALGDRAREAGDVDEELRRLEADLAELDEEERRLDREMADLVDPPEEAEPIRHDEDAFAGRLGALGERIADLVGTALSAAGRSRATDVVEREVAVVPGQRVRLRVDSFAGSVGVVAGPDDRVHVTAERHGLRPEDLAAVRVDVAQEGDEVVVTARSDAHLPRSWVRLTIEVPAGTPASVATRGGSIRVDRTAAAVRARTSGGSIKVRGGAGDADVETAGGSIRIEDHDGRATARTVGGSITVGGRIAGPIELRTVGGSIDADGVDGEIVASTKGGSIRVRGRLAGASSLDTAGGSITVHLRPGSRISVVGRGSAATTDVPGLVARAGEVSGTVEGGGDGELRAVTAAGAIRIAFAQS